LAREAPKAGDTEGRPFEVVKPKSTANPLPEFFEPMKAKLVDSRPVAGSWIYEIKFDGYRALALRGGAAGSRCLRVAAFR